ncbi:hypothetical protein BUALT_Bualt16G0001100 [Buddleja alternifolia]|uniref:chorismate synthase n=1 Tax=Buddleja alternifolia TaxID=168488 RepID=A0AAV6W9L3_9LAMI|nr:hypothetical protein BUALT_Bualt16G0001100 [Buddleja alternifolia]
MAFALATKHFLRAASSTDGLPRIGSLQPPAMLASPSLHLPARRSQSKCLVIHAAGSTYGTYFRVTTFGESHGGGVGCIIDGCPPRLPLSEADLQVDLDRRRPGQSRITTPRKETDTCTIASGIVDGLTTGSPIKVEVPNTDQRGNDYNEMSLAYRPSHGDASSDFKYGVRSVQGGGRSSARETIGRVVAGAIAKKILKLYSGTEILAYASQVHNVVLPEGLVDHETVNLDQNFDELNWELWFWARIVLVDRLKSMDEMMGILSEEWLQTKSTIQNLDTKMIKLRRAMTVVMVTRSTAPMTIPNPANIESLERSTARQQSTILTVRSEIGLVPAGMMKLLPWSGRKLSYLTRCMSKAGWRNRNGGGGLLSICSAIGISGPLTLRLKAICKDLSVNHTCHFGVKLGDGRRMDSTGIYRDSTIHLESTVVRTDCYRFPLGGVDMVLGIACWGEDDSARRSEDRCEVSLKLLLRIGDVEVTAMLVEPSCCLVVTATSEIVDADISWVLDRFVDVFGDLEGLLPTCLTDHLIELLQGVGLIDRYRHMQKDEIEKLMAEMLTSFLQSTFFQIEDNIVRCPNPEYAEKMIAAIDAVRVRGDSVGGVVTCIVRHVPRGLGSPVFDKLEAEFAKAALSLPATKGFEFGSGFAGTFMTGSEHNDEFYVDEHGRIRTKTNRSGGIQGGISNGEIINMRIGFKPTSTISVCSTSLSLVHLDKTTYKVLEASNALMLEMRQKTVTRAKRDTELIARGRHDPCVVPRAVPMVEAMVAIVLADQLLAQHGQCYLFPINPALQEPLEIS